jgi:GNAT superfamily N-acetyltransferase
VTVTRVAEIDVDAATHDAVTVLLRESFPGYPDRSYFKLPPHFRLLALLDGVLVGHLGGELRMIRVGERVVRAVGVVDLCVRTRGRGIATRLLAEACAVDCEYAVLFADDERVYTRNGFVRVDCPVTWVKVHEHRTLGLSERVVPGCMMVKPLSGTPWPSGDVDLLGHLF